MIAAALQAGQDNPAHIPENVRMRQRPVSGAVQIKRPVAGHRPDALAPLVFEMEREQRLNSARRVFATDPHGEERVVFKFR